MSKLEEALTNFAEGAVDSSDGVLIYSLPDRVVGWDSETGEFGFLEKPFSSNSVKVLQPESPPRPPELTEFIRILDKMMAGLEDDDWQCESSESLLYQLRKAVLELDANLHDHTDYPLDEKEYMSTVADLAAEVAQLAFFIAATEGALDE